jgi:hypothetical protein
VNYAALQNFLLIYLHDECYHSIEYLRLRRFFVIIGASSMRTAARVLNLVQVLGTMATAIQHRKVNIVALDAGETIAACCQPGDIAIVAQADGWSLNFIDRDGAVHGYDRPYASYNEALWAAKAAAEYGVD